MLAKVNTLEAPFDYFSGNVVPNFVDAFYSKIN